MSKSNIDPVLPSGDLTMGQVSSMFQRLILEKSDPHAAQTVLRKYGRVVFYTEEIGASNPDLKSIIQTFINGAEPMPEGARPDLDMKVGDNLTLLLIRAENVQNLGQENEMAIDNDLPTRSTHWTTLNLRKIINRNGEIEIRYADSIGEHNRRDKIPNVITEALELAGIDLTKSQKDFLSTHQTGANCGYMAVWHALKMHEVEIETDPSKFIEIQRKFLPGQEEQPTDQNHEEDFKLATKDEEQTQDRFLPSQLKVDPELIDDAKKIEALREIITSRSLIYSYNKALKFWMSQFFTARGIDSKFKTKDSTSTTSLKHSAKITSVAGAGLDMAPTGFDLAAKPVMLAASIGSGSFSFFGKR